MKKQFDILAVYADDSTELFKVRADNYEQAEKFIKRHYGAVIAHWTGYAIW